ncbi:CRISPR-associated protein Cas5 [Streptomyces sp. NPDC102437]|uniref:CRISPR-associated protein Cas5 n=1 Tax=Streptomyces sp. NPDC102437 TaxID=3366175 RepID=UPI003815D42C
MTFPRFRPRCRATVRRTPPTYRTLVRRPHLREWTFSQVAPTYRFPTYHTLVRLIENGLGIREKRKRVGLLTP